MRQRLPAIRQLIRRAHRWWLQTEPYITVFGSLGFVLMTAFWTWVVSTIHAINALGWGVWLVLGLFLALTSLVAVAVAAWLADRFRTKPADRSSPQTPPSLSRDPALNSSEPQARAEDFPPQYDELLAFFLNYLTPVVHAHRALREAIVEKGVDNEKIRTLALRSLAAEDLDRSFSFAADPLAYSPAERPSFRTLTTAIHNAEFSYQQCIAERDDLARSLGLTIKSDEKLFRLWNDWRRKHNALVIDYEKVKRDQRFGILFRPLRESKWGGQTPED